MNYAMDVKKQYPNLTKNLKSTKKVFLVQIVIIKDQNSKKKIQEKDKNKLIYLKKTTNLTHLIN